MAGAGLVRWKWVPLICVVWRGMMLKPALFAHGYEVVFCDMFTVVRAGTLL